MEYQLWGDGWNLNTVFTFPLKICFIANYLIATPFLSHSISSEYNMTFWEILTCTCVLHFISKMLSCYEVFNIYIRHLLYTPYNTKDLIEYQVNEYNERKCIWNRISILCIHEYNLSWNRKPFLFCLISQYLVNTILRILIYIHFSLLVRVH